MTWFVRWGIGLVAVLAGVVCLILNLGGFGLEELFGFIGAGLSIILINYLFRLGVQSDREHEAHEQEWRYYEAHGHWPDERPAGPSAPPPSGHRRSGHHPDRSRRRPG